MKTHVSNLLAVFVMAGIPGASAASPAKLRCKGGNKQATKSNTGQ